MTKLIKFVVGVLCAQLMFAPFVYGVSPSSAPPAAVVVAKPIKIVTTLAVIAAVAREIGGSHVMVNNLTAPGEDPHFVKAKPTFKRLVSDADLFMQIGRSLELWVPQVIAAGGNSKLSGAGIVSVSAGMKALEVPSTLTRDKGDIHPQGNPHIWLSPLGGLKMAENIKAALVAIDAAHKDSYEKNFIAFKDKLSLALFGDELIRVAGSTDFLWRLHEGKKLTSYVASKKKSLGGWLLQASSIDYPFITYHSVWTYLVDEFGLKFFAAIEEKSGVAPAPKYLSALITRAQAANVKHVFDARYYVGNSKVIDMVATGIGGKKLFVDADCNEGETYVDMMNRIIKELVAFKAAPPAAPVDKSAPLKK